MPSRTPAHARRPRKTWRPLLQVTACLDSADHALLGTIPTTHAIPAINAIRERADVEVVEVSRENRDRIADELYIQLLPGAFPLLLRPDHCRRTIPQRRWLHCTCACGRRCVVSLLRWGQERLRRVRAALPSRSTATEAWCRQALISVLVRVLRHRRDKWRRVCSAATWRCTAAHCT